MYGPGLLFIVKQGTFCPRLVLSYVDYFNDMFLYHAPAALFSTRKSTAF